MIYIAPKSACPMPLYKNRFTSIQSQNSDIKLKNIDKLKKGEVLKEIWNCLSNLLDFLMWSSREFHIMGAETEKAPRPELSSSYFGFRS